MLSEAEAGQMLGSTAYDNEGGKIGKVGQLFLDDSTGRPEFITINTGLFGTSESFVPVQNARMDGDSVIVPFPKDKVKDAPSVDLDGGHLDEPEEQRLYEYYGLSYGDGTSGTETSEGVAQVGRDTSGPETDDAMTRSEERLAVGITSQESGRVRLRKYVTTETETQTVPVRKEKAVLEREPVTDANVDRAAGGPAISEEEHEVVLHEERPVVETTVEPVERVRLSTETATEEETVSEEVRKEHIEAEDDVQDRR
jgi:uncharacterized protein (TIGR02271 family)